jgi:hypothetical protein
METSCTISDCKRETEELFNEARPIFPYSDLYCASNKRNALELTTIPAQLHSNLGFCSISGLSLLCER